MVSLWPRALKSAFPEDARGPSPQRTRLVGWRDSNSRVSGPKPEAKAYRIQLDLSAGPLNQRKSLNSWHYIAYHERSRPISSTEDETHARAFAVEVGQFAWLATDERDKAADDDAMKSPTEYL